jgi:hypothetical protein
MGYNSIQGVCFEKTTHLFTILTSMFACLPQVQEEFSQRYNAGCVRSARLRDFIQKFKRDQAEEDRVDGDPWQLTTPRCMNKIDYAIQKSKRKGYATMDAFWVCHAATQCSVCNTWCIYDNNEHTLVWVASWLPRIKDRMKVRCICKVGESKAARNNENAQKRHRQLVTK